MRLFTSFLAVVITFSLQAQNYEMLAYMAYQRTDDQTVRFVRDVLENGNREFAVAYYDLIVENDRLMKERDRRLEDALDDFDPDSYQRRADELNNEMTRVYNQYKSEMSRAGKLDVASALAKTSYELCVQSGSSDCTTQYNIYSNQVNMYNTAANNANQLAEKHEALSERYDRMLERLKDDQDEYDRTVSRIERDYDRDQVQIQDRLDEAHGKLVQILEGKLCPYTGYHENGRVQVKSFVEITDLEHFTGPTTYYDESGNKVQEGTFVNGALDGLIKKFHTNGQLQSEETLVRGVRHGRSIQYYTNGKVEQNAEYYNGVLHGPLKAYWESGELRLSGTYDNGRMVGSWTGYYESGQEVQYEAVNGELVRVD